MKAAVVIFVACSVAGFVAWCAAHGSVDVVGIPVPFAAAALAFVVQWVAFVPAYVKQTERFYDLTGSLTYLGVIWTVVLASGSFDARSFLLAGVISVWAVRLGTFLFRRVHRDGGDGRFDEIKPNPQRFLVAWTLQGLWVFLTLSAAIAAIASEISSPLNVIDLVGFSVWGLGFGLEVVADRQKSQFRAENPGDFIDVGLWSWSRHPNYFGEIVLWIGIAVVAASTLSGWQWVTLISPVFVIFLLTKVSGIPLLEKRAEERWGDDPAYQSYRDRTSVLVPLPPG